MRKKHILALLVALLLLTFCLPVQAAEESALENANLGAWENGSPVGWDFYSPRGTLEEWEEDGNTCAKMVLSENNFALLTQEVTLEPQSVYRVTCRVKTEGEVTGAYPAVNLNFEGQLAEVGGVQDTQGEWQELELYVATNVDEEQTYVVRAGMGYEGSPSSGTLYLDDISIEELDEKPDDREVYTLVGSLGTGIGDGGSSAAASTPWYEQADVSYNDIGVALMGVLLLVALYLLITSRWAGKVGKLFSGRGWMVFLFLAAFLLRVFISVREPGHVTDLDCFKSWALTLPETGLSGFYESGIFVDYPPLYMYVLYVIGWIAKLFGMTADSVALGVLVRLPALLADLGLAYVCYRFVSKHLNKETGILLSLFLLLSPALITTSASWGQMDSVFLLALVGALILLYRDKKVYAALLWMAAFLIKPQALFVAPIFLFVFLGDLFQKERWKRTLAELGLSLAGMALIYIVVALPMKGGQDFFYVFQNMSQGMEAYQLGSVNAFNLMCLLGGNFVSDTANAFFTTYNALGTALICVVILATGLLYFKKRDKKSIFLLAALLVAGIFTLGHQMHERYILPAVVLLLFAAAVYNSRRVLLSAVYYSALAFLNIFIVYIFKADPVYTVVYQVVSILSLGAFVCLVFVVLRQLVFPQEEKAALAVISPEIPIYRERRRSAAKERLEHVNPHVDRRMHKKDYLVMLGITAIYAVFAFTNLGSLVIPERTQPIEKTGTQIVLELSEETEIKHLKYYAGYCEGDFDVFYSDDGVGYREIDLRPEASESNPSPIMHKYSNMFKWRFFEMNAPAKYVKLTLTSGTMEFREIALTGVDGKPLSIVNATIDGQAAPWLVDEQDQVPETTTYMTDMYFDEVYHARTAYEYMENIYPYEITHPPLGKSIITLGIQLFGFNPFGWRFMGALFGVLILPVTYILGKRLFKKTLWAGMATALFATDFMHYALTRIATIDSYSLFFILLMYLFMYEYTQHNFNKEKLSRTFLPLGLCGLAFGLGAATKWLCLYAGLGLAILFFYTVYQRVQEYHYAKEEGIEEVVSAFKKKLTFTILFCVLVFILIPIAIYCISYIPYFNARPDFGLEGIWKNQEYMLNYHGNLTTTSPHPYQSSIYTWPFAIRPVFFFLAENAPAGMTGVIWCMPSPIIAWGGIAAVLYLIGLRGQGKCNFKGLPFVAIAAFSQLWPWTVITREVFIYHYFAAMPFLIYAIVYAMRYIWENYKHGKKLVIGFLILCILAFFLFYPVITGTLVPRWLASLARWLPTWPL